MIKEYIDGLFIWVLVLGLVGGVIGFVYIGLVKGVFNLLCVDMGGIFYDMLIVLNGMVLVIFGWNMYYCYLIGMLMVQVEILGVGGGLICQINVGEVQVGLCFVGFDFGFMCYGCGGIEFMVIDVLLMLGIFFVDGEFVGGSFLL